MLCVDECGELLQLEPASLELLYYTRELKVDANRVHTHVSRMWSPTACIAPTTPPCYSIDSASSPGLASTPIRVAFGTV
jgi:hypothetical protein